MILSPVAEPVSLGGKGNCRWRAYPDELPNRLPGPWSTWASWNPRIRWTDFQAQFAAGVVEAKNRAELGLVVANSYLVGVFRCPGAARGDGFVAMPAPVGGPLQPGAAAHLHRVLAAFVSYGHRAAFGLELNCGALKFQIVTLQLIGFFRSLPCFGDQACSSGNGSERRISLASICRKLLDRRARFRFHGGSNVPDVQNGLHVPHATDDGQDGVSPRHDDSIR